MMFNHSGDMGDIIYSLPTIKKLGGGELEICALPKSHHGMTVEKYDFLFPLLDLQTYLNGLKYSNEAKVNSKLNRFRERTTLFGLGYTLIDVHLACYGLPPWNGVPWIDKDWATLPKHGVVINRTHRYRNPSFPWQRVVNTYNCTFIGHEDEYLDFKNTFKSKSLSFKKISNSLEAAMILDSCALFIGNQSLFAAIATGLGIPMIQEVAGLDCGYAHMTCLFETMNRINGRIDNFNLPEIKND